MARKVILYISVSLDGYIADQLRFCQPAWQVNPEECTAENFTDMKGFISGTDTILMGMNTYRQITEELSTRYHRPYRLLKSYVLYPQRKWMTERGMRFHTAKAPKVSGRFEAQSGKHIWVCGGSISPISL